MIFNSNLDAYPAFFLHSLIKKGGTPMKRICLFLALLLSCSISASALSLSSGAGCLMEKTTGKVIFAQNEHAPYEPASVTKVMTLLLIMEAIDNGTLSYDDPVTASTYAASMGGSQIWLKEGETMTVEELLKAICVVSGNDASVAMAEHLAGSEEAFAEKMNTRAKELGMNDTHFVNCTGLPAEGHVTSAYDIALMSRELILNHPDIRRFTTIWMDSLRNGASSLVNTNKLIRFYEGATGLKTGSTDAAGYCLSATAERNGMELIATVLKSDTSQNRFDDARAMLDHGFATYSLVSVRPDEAIPPLEVQLGSKATVQPLLSGADTLLLEKSKAADITTCLTLPENVKAPISKGDPLGELQVDCGGETVARIPLVAGESVDKLTVTQIFLSILQGTFPQS